MKHQLLPQPTKRRRNVWQWYSSRRRAIQISLVCAVLVVLIILGLGVSAVIGSQSNISSHDRARVVPTSTVTTKSTKPAVGATPTLTPTPTIMPTPQPTATPYVPETGLLPGQQIWKNGVSSYIFGTGDTQEFSDNNLQTNTTTQQMLRSAGFTLVRSDFEDNATDAVIEQRMKTIENIGAHGICAIHNIFNLTYDQHLVSYLGPRCLMYEIGNELDIGDDVYSRQGDFRQLTAQEYINQWNTLVPMLRKINPNARFIGPATYNDQGNSCFYEGDNTHCFMQDFLTGVKASGILPDAVSFHWYPCFEDTKDACLAKASTYGDVIREVKGWVRTILERDLPVGLTEWNFDPGSNLTLGNDSAFMRQFTTDALNSMIQAKADFATQFEAQSYGGYGALDMFDSENNGEPKAQFYAMRDVISQYKP
jgi:Glycosyl hydrolase catalytic core